MLATNVNMKISFLFCLIFILGTDRSCNGMLSDIHGKIQFHCKTGPNGLPRILNIQVSLELEQKSGGYPPNKRYALSLTKHFKNKCQFYTLKQQKVFMSMIFHHAYLNFPLKYI